MKGLLALRESVSTLCKWFFLVSTPGLTSNSFSCPISSVHNGACFISCDTHVRGSLVKGDIHI